MAQQVSKHKFSTDKGTGKDFLRTLPGFFLVVILGWQCQQAEQRIFDGESFEGWEGDTLETWKIVDGTIVGGSLDQTVPHNDFLCTTTSYDDFALRLKFKLTGSEGFINAGVQFRSKRMADPAHEMIGYQADLGDGYWGSLYDESRRKKVLISADSLIINRILKKDGWNDYEIRADGKRIQLFINGTKTVDYTETDDSIPQNGLIGLQIHGGGKALVSYRDIYIERL